MTNDFSFDSVKQNGYTVKVSDRRPQNSGVSYDYMDQLNKYIDQGIFVDKDGDGFTSAEKRALGDEFAKIHKEKGYSSKFTKMQKNTGFSYTYDEFVRLAQAAGYVLKEDASAPAAKKEAKAPDTAAPKAETDKPAATTPEVTTPAKESEDNAKQPPVTVLNQVAAGLPDGNYDITFHGHSVSNDETGEVYEQTTHATVVDANGNKSKVTTSNHSHRPELSDVDALPAQAKADKPAAVTETAAPQTKEEVPAPQAKEEPAAAAEPVVTPAKEETPAPQAAESLNDDADFASLSYDEKLKAIHQMQFDIQKDISDAERTSYTTTRPKRFLGIKAKVLGTVTETHNYTPEELAQRQQNLPQLKAELEEATKQEVSLREIDGNEYWNGKYSPASTLNADGTVARKNGTYRRVVTADGRKIAAVDTYDPKTFKTTTRYYNVTVAKTGEPEIYKGTQYEVVPDFDNELTGVELKK